MLHVPSRRRFVTGAAALSALAALPDWKTGKQVVPSPPPAAVALGYTRLSFFDNFLIPGTIDDDNTKAPGFHWYRSAVWPFGVFNINTTFPNTNYSIVNGVLRMNTTQPGIIVGLATACSGPDANTYNGTVFTGGAYFEASMAYDPTLSTSGNTSWPAFWGFGIRHGIDPTCTQFIEPDFFEAFPAATGAVTKLMGFHDWKASSLKSRFLNPPITLSGTFNLNTFHKYASSWVPMVDNGGTGLIKRYFDDANVSAANFSYTATTDSTPASSADAGDPPSATGVFSDMDDSPGVYLILSCGENMPSYWDYVAVWQKPL